MVSYSQTNVRGRYIFSGDLDEEAMLVVEFERAYQANARLITVLNQLTQDTINMLGG